MRPLTEAYKAEKDHEKAAAIRDQFEPYNERMDVITDEFIKTHPDSYLSPYLMRFRLMSLPVGQVENAYNHWTERVKNSRSGKEIAEEIKKLKQGSPGSPATMFNRKDINDKMLNLEEIKGKKYILLDFWASWCISKSYTRNMPPKDSRLCVSHLTTRNHRLGEKQSRKMESGTSVTC